MAFLKNKVERNDTINNYDLKQQNANVETVLKREVDLSEKYDTIVYVAIGDWHIGSVDFDINEAIKVINYVLQTPNARLACIGDMMNTAILGSVSSMFEDIAYPEEQWEVFISLLKDVAKQQKVIVIHTGNHERRVIKNTGIDLVKQAATGINASETYAPYFADTKITLRSAYTANNKFSFDVVTHHGDSGNPENNSSVNRNSSINLIGHTHNQRAYVKTKFVTDENNKQCKQDELDIVVPSCGGGLYGNEKGLKPLNKCPYYALEITTAPNPLYNANDKLCLEQPVVLATKSIPILTYASTDKKAKCINEGMKTIDKCVKNAKPKVLAKILEILDIFEDCGMEINRNLKSTITKQILLNPNLRKKSCEPQKIQDNNSEIER